MTNGDREAEIVDEPVELVLPQAQSVPVASAAVGGDQERTRIRIPRRAHFLPPRADGLHGEFAGVVAEAHADPRFVLLKIVDAIWRSTSLLGVDEVMNLDVVGITMRSEFATAVLEIPDELLLLRVHGDDRLVRFELSTDRLVDVFELRVAVRMLRAFEPLAIRLKAVPELLEQPRHHVLVRLMALLLECCDDVSLAARRPQ